jgi:cellulose synthase/poly-beta-1,6-N-acetylglucosamine synthase-like glycosyltransferase
MPFLGANLILHRSKVEPTIKHLPNVSVIVPVFNAERTIEECINSLLELDYPSKNLELIFINNASNDRTADILSYYSGKIKILYERKRGPAAARNKGILNANGDIIAFTDADCVVDKDWLKHIVRPLEDNSIGIVGGEILAKHPCNKIEEFYGKLHDHKKAAEGGMPYSITINWASRKSVFKETGLFDESFLRGQDTDLSFRILRSGYKFFYEPRAIVYHRFPKTLAGLFYKAYLSGFYSIKFYKKHEEYHKRLGIKGLHTRTHKQNILRLYNYIQRKNPDDSILYFTHYAGRTLGKIAGSIRFFYLDI